MGMNWELSELEWTDSWKKTLKCKIFVCKTFVNMLMMVKREQVWDEDTKTWVRRA